jgi:glycosyltransferase involved in cell wall biosynthesis
MLVMTMMVRDEADLIAATIEHHLAQGVDRIIVTDNASVDGTREILEAYARVAPLTIHDDPEHRKQQGRVVTRMAREAHALGATWVVNADADEFLRPVASDATLRDVLGAMPTELGEVRVPVINLVGRIAGSGAGFDRLVLRDERDQEALEAAGVLSQPTPNAIHVGSPDVEVVQGNHSTSIGVRGEVPEGLELEVLHLPWRSVAQVVRKTENMGRGYDASPELQPSANHHGMRDWRRLRGGVLLPFLALRMPTSEEMAQDGLRRDESLPASLRALDAVLPASLAEALADGDVYDDGEIHRLRAEAAALRDFDRAAQDDVSRARAYADEQREELVRVVEDRDGIAYERELLRRELERVQAEVEGVRGELETTRARVDELEGDPVHRAAQRVRRVLHR